ncbi:MAG: hypothetical protein ACRDIE_12120 [Chloroflexota bacterium]
MPVGALPVLIAIAGSAAILAFSSLSLIDDAYISVRYAYNLNAGLGFVFNPGEHVEGYSNLLWTLLLTVPLRLSMSVDVFAVVAGTVFGILAVYDAYRICRRMGVGIEWACAAMVPLAFNADYWLSVTNGLEGGLFSFLLLRTVYLVLSGGGFVMAGLCGGLLFMTRPEGLLVVPVCAVYLQVRAMFGADGSIKLGIRRILPLLISWLGVVTLVTLWRLLYYHAWLPNTVTAKAPPREWSVYLANARAGIQYWEAFLQAAPAFVLGAIVAIALGWRRPVVYLVLALVAIEVPTVLVNGGDWMPHYRLIVVFLPLLGVLLGIALEELASPPRPAPLLWPVLRWSTTLFLVAMFLLGVPYRIWDHPPSGRIGVTEPCYQAIAYAIRPRMIAADRISAEAMGEFSYILISSYSHDMQGLTDSYVAHHGTAYDPRFGRADFAYTYNQVQPTVIVVHDVSLLSGLAAAAHGGYAARYATFLFPTLPGCSGRPMWVSLDRNAVTRLLPALAPFHPQIVAALPTG